MGVAAKVIHREVNKAGLAEDILGEAGNVNVQGEDQKKLDVFADEIFIKLIEGSGIVAGIGSEENDDYLAFDGPAQKGKYVLLMDPLDGSSNIDVNVSIGTIFSIFKRVTDNNGPVNESDFHVWINTSAFSGFMTFSTKNDEVSSKHLSIPDKHIAIFINYSSIIKDDRYRHPIHWESY